MMRGGGVWYLSLQHALHRRGQTGILVACLGVTLFLPAAADVLLARYERDLRARAAGTPLVLGSRGNRFDLTLAALYFRASELEPVPTAELARIRDAGLGVAVPIHARFTARGHPVVGTSPEYFELRGLAARDGALPLFVGEAALGANVARKLGLGPGEALFSDQKELYDISKPPALKMRVCGVLAEAGTPDDDAVFVDVKTAWILEGLAHGHGDVTKEVDESLVLGRTDDSVTVSLALIEYNEVTPENAASFHVHTGPGALPLTAILVFPPDDKARTVLKARVNAEHEYQMLVPSEVIADLLAFVFRIKSLFDTVTAVLAVTTLALTTLVVLLSMRLRRAEMRTLDRIGASRFTVAKLYATEIALVLVGSALLAGAGVGAASYALPNLLRVL